MSRGTILLGYSDAGNSHIILQTQSQKKQEHLGGSEISIKSILIKNKGSAINFIWHSADDIYNKNRIENEKTRLLSKISMIQT